MVVNVTQVFTFKNGFISKNCLVCIILEEEEKYVQRRMLEDLRMIKVRIDKKGFKKKKLII